MEKQVLDKKDIFDRIMGLPVLNIFEPFYLKYKEVLLYLFFGGLTTVISIGSYGYCCYLGMDALVANIISWILAVLFAYITNSIWVFKSKPETLRQKLSEMASFYGGRVATLLMEEAVLWVGIDFLGGDKILVKVIAQILVLVGNYIISKFFVFK